MQFGNGLPLLELMTATDRSAEDLRGRFGAAFLVVDASELDESDEEVDTNATVRVTTARGMAMIAMKGSFVFPLVNKPTSVFDFVSIGRNEGNDVWLPHISVSRFHAYFRETDGGFVFQDAKSEGGTFIDDAPVARQGEGAPAPITSGQVVRFGGVDCTFLDAEDLAQLFAP